MPLTVSQRKASSPKFVPVTLAESLAPTMTEPSKEVAVARLWLHIKTGGREEKADMIAGWHARGYPALDVMEQHLGSNDYFVGGAYSIADIALYANTQMASDADSDLADYPKIRAWVERVAGQPGHVGLDWI